MSDLTATVIETKNGFHVDGYEKISYDFTFLDGVFNPENPQLAECYKRWGRVLAVTDLNVYNVYGEQIEKYFKHHGVELKVHKTKIGEKAKTIPTFLSIVDSMTEFGIYRKVSPTTPSVSLAAVMLTLYFRRNRFSSLVVDSLPTLLGKSSPLPEIMSRHSAQQSPLQSVPDLAHANLGLTYLRFACAAYRRNTNFIRVPTTVIGLIDASVSIKVAVNYGNYKNRLGAYHAPMHTFLDFTFLRTLPTAQIRNGFAELIKISTCSHLDTFNLLDKYCEQLIETGFGRTDGAPKEVRDAADKINKEGIHEMLKLETPNLHEIGLDRVIAYGHTFVVLPWTTFDVMMLIFEQVVTVARAPARNATTTWSRHINRYGLLGNLGQQ